MQVEGQEIEQARGAPFLIDKEHFPRVVERTSGA